jgi:hypothetical protein
MMHAQVKTRDTRGRRRYEPLLAERIELGRQLADALSHLRELEPLSRLIFNRLLTFDAELATFQRYDQDLSQVLAAEDERLHHPPEVPVDHQVAPCSHCLRTVLQLDPELVLPAQARRPR